MLPAENINKIVRVQPVFEALMVKYTNKSPLQGGLSCDGRVKFKAFRATVSATACAVACYLNTLVSESLLVKVLKKKKSDIGNKIGTGH